MKGCVNTEGVVAIRPLTSDFTIDVNCGVRHGSIKVDIRFSSVRRGGNIKCFTIPADAFPRKFAGFVFDLHAEWSFDRPVVWQVKRAPFGIVKCNLVRTGRGIRCGRKLWSDRFVTGIESGQLPDAGPRASTTIDLHRDVAGGGRECQLLGSTILWLFLDDCFPGGAVCGDSHGKRVFGNFFPINFDTGEFGAATEVQAEPLVFCTAGGAPASVMLAVNGIGGGVPCLRGGCTDKCGFRPWLRQHHAAWHFAKTGELPIRIERCSAGDLCRQL